jgi:hypothetical protein
MLHGSYAPHAEHTRALQAVFEEVAEDLFFLDGLARDGGPALGETDPYRELLDRVQADVARTLASMICDRADKRLAAKLTCLCANARRERARRELAALDVFANSTAYEEYRPS